MKKLLLVSMFCSSQCFALTPEDIDDIFVDVVQKTMHTPDDAEEALGRGLDVRLHQKATEYVQVYCKRNKIDHALLPAQLKQDIAFAAKHLCSNVETQLAPGSSPASPEKILHQTLDRILPKLLLPNTRYFEGKAIGDHCTNEVSTFISMLNIPAQCVTKSMKCAIIDCQEKSHNSVRDLMTRSKKSYVTNHEASKVTDQHKQVLIKQLWRLVQGYVFDRTIQFLKSNHADDTIFEVPANLEAVQRVADNLRSLITDL